MSSLDLSPTDLDRLRGRLSGYTVDAVWALIGEEGQRGLARNSTLAADRALGSSASAVATMTRLWLLQQPLPRARVEAALPGCVGPLLAAGLLQASGAEVRALVDIRPYASDEGPAGWVASDLTPGLDGPPTLGRDDRVLGISSASTTLAELTIRRPVERALDLGTGCGVQTLHLARHCADVVATDLNARALALARLTLGLSEVAADLRTGDLYAPVAEESFDLITSNPPYVMSPPEGSHLTYREAGRPGDALVEAVVREGARRLNPGGTLQVLGNWAHVEGQDWRERLTGWVNGTGCDAFVVQREVLDPYEYIEVWLADAGLFGTPEYVPAYRRWLDYFDTLGISGVGMGWLALRRTDRDRAHVRLEEWPYAIAQPVGAAIDAHLAAVDASRLTPDEVLGRRWRLAEDVEQETVGEPGAPDPRHIVLRQRSGLRRGLEVDTALGALLGACDGDLSAGALAKAVAELTDSAAADVAAGFCRRFPELILNGYLT